MITSSTTVETRALAIRAKNLPARVEQAARQRIIDACPYRYYFRNVAFEFDEGVLAIYGRVPSFYLKQVLQTVLAGLPDIERIDNQVEVVNSAGLSSELL